MLMYELRHVNVASLGFVIFSLCVFSARASLFVLCVCDYR